MNRECLGILLASGFGRVPTSDSLVAVALSVLWAPFMNLQVSDPRATTAFFES